MAISLNVFYRRLPLLLLLLALAQSAWLLLVDPVIGYANNYDFIRQSACLGIWHQHPEVDKFGVYVAYPAEHFIYDGDIRQGNCEPTSDLMFLHALSHLHEQGDVFPRWQLGGLKLITGVLLCALALWRPVPGWQLPGMLLLTALGLEWALLAYANTLYAEFSVLLAFVVVALAGAGLLGSGRNASARYVVLLLLGLAWLGTTKVQWMIWAALLAAGYLVMLLLQGRRWLVACLPGILAAVLWYSQSSILGESARTDTQLHRANLTNTFLYTVLPAAADVSAALEQLGLPQHCSAGVGQNWYSPGMADNPPCPELTGLSRSALLPLFTSQPSTLYRPLLHAIDLLRWPAPGHLGMISQTHPYAQAKLQQARLLAPSYWLGKLPPRGFKALASAVILAGPLAFLGVCLQLLRGRRASPALYWVALGGLTCGYSLFSSVFGDGYIDLHRHAILFWPGLLAALIGLLQAVMPCSARVMAITTQASMATTYRLALLSLIVGALLLAAALGFVQDDAFISFRYADNWVQGLGMVWNPGEPALEGYTNFLWVVLLGAGIWLGQDPVYWSYALGGLAGAGSLLLTAWLTRQLTGSRRLALLALFLLATNYSYSAYITGGLETQLQAFLLLAAACLAWRSQQAAGQSPVALLLLSLCCSLAFLTRMDSALPCLVLLAYAAWQLLYRPAGRQYPLQALALLILPGAVLAASWLLWKYMVYGDLLPNTFYAKAAQTLSLERGVKYAWLFYMSYGLLPFLLHAWLHVRGYIRQHPFWLVLLVTVTLWTAYVIKVSGDFMEFRFFVPVMPFIYMLVVAALAGLPRWRRGLICTLLVTLSVLHGTGFTGLYEIESITSLRNNVHRQHGNWSGVGKALGRVFADLPQPPKIAVTAAGAISYYSGLPAFDMLGLNDSWIARNGIVIDTRPGHTRYTTIKYLVDSGVDLVVAHPRVVAQAAPLKTEAKAYLPLLVKGELEGLPLQVVGIPLDEHRRLDVLFVSGHPGVRQRINELGLPHEAAVLP